MKYLHELKHVIERELHKNTRNMFNWPVVAKSVTNIVKTYDGNDWLDFASFPHTSSTSDYDKVSLPWTSKLFKMYIITWKCPIKTDFHFHQSNLTMIKVLEGRLCENVLLNNEVFGQREYKKQLDVNDVSFITNEIGMHRIINSHYPRTVSLNIYFDYISNNHATINIRCDRNKNPEPEQIVNK